MEGIKNWPSDERPREKLLRRGAGVLSDAELLAIFLRTGTKGMTAVDVGRSLLKTFGDLHAVLAAPASELCAQHGMGLSKYALLQAALELSTRYVGQTLSEKSLMDNPDMTKSYFAAQLQGYKEEVFACAFLDAQCRLIQYEPLFYGSIHRAMVHPRVIIKRALYHNAAFVILAHNHPSGESEPSQADMQLTYRLEEALNFVDIGVMDHIVVGRGEAVSFKEQGLMYSDSKGSKTIN